ncbi:MAG TPA: UTP--glucose-1-phosphate uridylyltransferase, partial [bacterium]|nr:UTP--glucose-1-phosphate uridylyltransferase [bacterium]
KYKLDDQKALDLEQKLSLLSSKLGTLGKDRLKNAAPVEKLLAVQFLTIVLNNYLGWNEDMEKLSLGGALQVSPRYILDNQLLDGEWLICVGRTRLLGEILKYLGFSEQDLFAVYMPGHVTMMAKIGGERYVISDPSGWTGLSPLEISKQDLPKDGEISDQLLVKDALPLQLVQTAHPYSKLTPKGQFTVMRMNEGITWMLQANLSFGLYEIAGKRRGEDREKLLRMALGNLEKSSKICKDYPAVYLYLGRVAYDLAQTKAGDEQAFLLRYAGEQFQKAVDMEPRLGQAYTGLARVTAMHLKEKLTRKEEMDIFASAMRHLAKGVNYGDIEALKVRVGLIHRVIPHFEGIFSMDKKDLFERAMEDSDFLLKNNQYTPVVCWQSMIIRIRFAAFDPSRREELLQAARRDFRLFAGLASRAAWNSVLMQFGILKQEPVAVQGLEDYLSAETGREFVKEMQPLRSGIYEETARGELYRALSGLSVADLSRVRWLLERLDSAVPVQIAGSELDKFYEFFNQLEELLKKLESGEKVIKWLREYTKADIPEFEKYGKYKSLTKSLIDVVKDIERADKTRESISPDMEQKSVFRRILGAVLYETLGGFLSWWKVRSPFRFIERTRQTEKLVNLYMLKVKGLSLAEYETYLAHNLSAAEFSAFYKLALKMSVPDLDQLSERQFSPVTERVKQERRTNLIKSIATYFIAGVPFFARCADIASYVVSKLTDLPVSFAEGYTSLIDVILKGGLFAPTSVLTTVADPVVMWTSVLVSGFLGLGFFVLGYQWRKRHPGPGYAMMALSIAAQAKNIILPLLGVSVLLPFVNVGFALAFPVLYFVLNKTGSRQAVLRARRDAVDRLIESGMISQEMIQEILEKYPRSKTLMDSVGKIENAAEQVSRGSAIRANMSLSGRVASVGRRLRGYESFLISELMADSATAELINREIQREQDLYVLLYENEKFPMEIWINEKLINDIMAAKDRKIDMDLFKKDFPGSVKELDYLVKINLLIPEYGQDKKIYNVHPDFISQYGEYKAGYQGLPIMAEILPWSVKMKLTETDTMYLKGLLGQFRAAGSSIAGLVMGADFFNSALLTKEEREKDLNASELTELDKDPDNREAARKVRVINYPMNGGIGSSVLRKGWLAGIWDKLGRIGEAFLGAKASDLYIEVEYNGEKKMVSISEAKILRLLTETGSGQYAGVELVEMASTETEESINILFDSPCLIEPGKSYREVLKERGFYRDMMLQAGLPTIDKETGKLTDKRVAPGGHGQWGVMLLLEALKMQVPEGDEGLVGAVYNEDGINHLPDPTIVGWMHRTRVPMVLLTTTKTTLDMKGGQIGIVRLPDGRVKKDMLELAQAKNNGQEQMFYDMGLSVGEKGAQYFNTNMALLNYQVLVPFLKDLVGVIGIEEFNRIISPPLIKNTKKQRDADGVEREYIQMEGLIAAVLFGLDTYLALTDNAEVKGVLKKHGIERLLSIVNVDQERRTDFFTPVKNAFDFWFQFYSDYFTFSTESWKLKSNRPGVLPVVSLDKYYEDVKNVMDAFGRASTAGLDKLVIKGRVKLADAVLKGRVEIESAYDGVIDLNSDAVRNQMGLATGGRLIMQNAVIEIDEKGQVTLNSGEVMHMQEEGLPSAVGFAHMGEEAVKSVLQSITWQWIFSLPGELTSALLDKITLSKTEILSAEKYEMPLRAGFETLAKMGYPVSNIHVGEKVIEAKVGGRVIQFIGTDDPEWIRSEDDWAQAFNRGSVIVVHDLAMKNLSAVELAGIILEELKEGEKTPRGQPVTFTTMEKIHQQVRPEVDQLLSQINSSLTLDEIYQKLSFAVKSEFYKGTPESRYRALLDKAAIFARNGEYGRAVEILRPAVVELGKRVYKLRRAGNKEAQDLSVILREMYELMLEHDLFTYAPLEAGLENFFPVKSPLELDSGTQRRIREKVKNSVKKGNRVMIVAPVSMKSLALAVEYYNAVLESGGTPVFLTGDDKAISELKPEQHSPVDSRYTSYDVVFDFRKEEQTGTEVSFSAIFGTENEAVKAGEAAAKNLMQVDRGDIVMVSGNFGDEESFKVAMSLYDAAKGRKAHPLIVLQPIKHTGDSIEDPLRGILERIVLREAGSSAVIHVPLQKDRFGQDLKTLKDRGYREKIYGDGDIEKDLDQYLLDNRRLFEVAGPGIDIETFLQAGRADYKHARNLSRALLNRQEKLRSLEIIDKDGSSLTIDLSGDNFMDDTEVKNSASGSINVPGLEIMIAPAKYSRATNGIVTINHVIDVMGHWAILPDEPIRLTVENGFVTKIEGGAAAKVFEATIKDSRRRVHELVLSKQLEPEEEEELVRNALHIGEFAFGLDYNADVIVNVLNDEKIGGTIHLALGYNYSTGENYAPALTHYDLITEGQKVVFKYTDGSSETVLEDGRFVISDEYELIPEAKVFYDLAEKPSLRNGFRIFTVDEDGKVEIYKPVFQRMKQGLQRLTLRHIMNHLKVREWSKKIRILKNPVFRGLVCLVLDILPFKEFRYNIPVKLDAKIDIPEHEIEALRRVIYAADGLKPILGALIPESMKDKPGKGVWPADLTAKDYEAYVKAHAGDKPEMVLDDIPLKDLVGYMRSHPAEFQVVNDMRTVVRKTASGLTGMPYVDIRDEKGVSVREYILKAAIDLLEASDLTQDKNLKEYIRWEAALLLAYDPEAIERFGEEGFLPEDFAQGLLGMTYEQVEKSAHRAFVNLKNPLFNAEFTFKTFNLLFEISDYYPDQFRGYKMFPAAQILIPDDQVQKILDTWTGRLGKL